MFGGWSSYSAAESFFWLFYAWFIDALSRRLPANLGEPENPQAVHPSPCFLWLTTRI